MISLETVLRKRKAALMIIDVQNEFCHPDGLFGKNGFDLSTVNRVIPPLEALMDAAHSQGAPVIFITNVEDENTDSEAWNGRPDGAEDNPNVGVTRRGNWGTGIYGLTPAEGDIIMEKHRFSAFIDTPLKATLNELGVDTLVIGGLATNACVMNTSFHAVMNDFHVVVAEDAVSSWFEDLHEMALKNLRLFCGKVLPSKDIVECWTK